MKNMLLASAAVPALIYALPSQAQECTAAPDCATLGYTKTATQCSGKTYTRCPFDDTKYNCANDPTESECYALGYVDKKINCPEKNVACPGNNSYVRCVDTAKVGDLKYSLLRDNHDGWLLCKGSTYDPKRYPELYATIGNTFGGTINLPKLPNYVGYFLKGAAATSLSTLKTSQAAGLPDISGSFAVYGAEKAYSSGTGAFSLTTSGNTYSGHQTSGKPLAVFNFKASNYNSSSTVYGKSTTVTPMNYPANIFIYAGRVAAAASACESYGYLDSQPTGQTCTSVTITLPSNAGTTTCYKECKMANMLEICRRANPVNYVGGRWGGSNTFEYPGSPGAYCFGDYYDTCGNTITYYDQQSISSGCEDYASQIVADCELDASCMESQFNIPIEN